MLRFRNKQVRDSFAAFQLLTSHLNLCIQRLHSWCATIFLNFTGLDDGRNDCTAFSLPNSASSFSLFPVLFFFFFHFLCLVKFNATLGRSCSRYCWTCYFKLWLRTRRNFHLSSFLLHEFRYTCRRFPV